MGFKEEEQALHTTEGAGSLHHSACDLLKVLSNFDFLLEIEKLYTLYL